MSKVRILLVVALALMAFVGVLGTAYAQEGAATPMATPGAAGDAGATPTPATLPVTGGAGLSMLTVVLLAFGASAGLGGLLLRGLRQGR
jgi:hypothetical protein